MVGLVPLPAGGSWRALTMPNLFMTLTALVLAIMFGLFDFLQQTA
jgi:hypothetical protein